MGTALLCWWKCKLVQPLWKTVWRFLNKLVINLPYDPPIPLLGIYPEKTIILKDTCTVHCSIIYSIHESNLDVHQQMNGYRSCGTYVQWNVSHRMEQFESVVLRWMNLDPVKQSEVSKKEPSFEF